MNDFYKIITKPISCKKAYFDKTSLKWCSVPIPAIDDHKDGEFDFTDAQIAGYGQSMTHPSIVYIPDGFNGHKYWLSATPYPKAIGVFENPCVYYGDEQENGEPPILWNAISGGVATEEYPIVNNPVVKVSSTSATNSDSDIYYNAVTNKLCIISRDNINDHCYLYQESADGLAWSKRTEYPNYILSCLNDSFGVNAEMESPATFAESDGTTTIYGLVGLEYPTDSLKDNKNSVKGMFKFNGDVKQGISGMTKVCHASLLGAMNIVPWHMDIANYNSKYYMVFNAHDMRGGHFNLYMAISDDGVDFTVSPIPLFEIYNNYRPTLMIKDGKIYIYGSVIESSIFSADDFPRGESDIPIDGRAIYQLSGELDDVVSYLFEEVELR